MAIPAAAFRPDQSSRLESILALDGVEVHPLLGVPLRIRRAGDSSLATISKRASLDYGRGVVIGVAYDRRLVRLAAQYAENEVNSRAPTASPRDKRRREMVSVVFHGFVHRAVRGAAVSAIISANIADFGSFPVGSLVHMNVDRVDDLRGRFGRLWAYRPRYAEMLEFESIEPKLAYGAVAAVARGQEKTPLARAISNLSYSYSAVGVSAELSSLVWSLASIESLLNPHGRSIRRQIEDRLRVLFSSRNAGQIVESFKRLYQYRSDLMHGSLGIPMHMTDDSKLLDVPIEHNAFAFALASRLIQMCLGRGSQGLEFDLVLRR